MALIERYRRWYEHERDCNQKMLDMMNSVPIENWPSSTFQRSINLAAHLAACRENWLDRIQTGGLNQVDWWEEMACLNLLAERFRTIEDKWVDYLESLSDADLDRSFEYGIQPGKRCRWSIEGQIVQLLGHAFYHRGQIALLVDELGGETVDTDYLYWAMDQDSRFGPISWAGPSVRRSLNQDGRRRTQWRFRNDC